MRKMVFAGGLALFALGFAANALAVKSRGGGEGGASGAMSVQVRSSTVRSTPNYLSSATGKLGYGQQVSISEEQGNWCRIESPSGWVPKNDLTKHKVAMNPDQKFSGSGGRHDEVALAGKGFNPQVEQQFKRDHPDLARAFAEVDRIETFSSSEAQLRSFQTAGKLSAR